MARKVYGKLLTQQEVLQALRQGVYKVNLETGEVTNGGGKVVTPFVDDDGRKFVRLYYKDRRRAIAVARLVWMKGCNCTIPVNFEVHHANEIPTDDRFDNLICVHKIDHDKLHRDQAIPF